MSIGLSCPSHAACAWRRSRPRPDASRHRTGRFDDRTHSIFRPPTPTADELARIIATTRGIALNYTVSMPNFVCIQRVTRFVAPPGAPRWIPNDSQTIEVGYSTKKGESYKLIAINDKPTTKKLEKTTASIRAASLDRCSCHVSSRGADPFLLERWTTVHNRSAYVLSYKVDLPNSTYSVDLREGKKRYAGITGVKGLVFIDRETNQVMRLTAEADDLPPVGHGCAPQPFSITISSKSEGSGISCPPRSIQKCYCRGRTAVTSSNFVTIVSSAPK